MRVIPYILVCLAATAGCFDPKYAEGITCSEANTCPPGQHCDLASNVCRSMPGGVDAAPVDATVDARVIPPHPCEAADDPCAPGGVCVAEAGGYRCDCQPGYTDSGGTCADIDECAAGPDPCAPGGTCINTPGAYECMCNMHHDFDGVTCVPIVIEIVGDGTEALPRRWADGTAAASCLGYRQAEAPYVYEGSTGDGIYEVEPQGSQPFAVHCDMTANGGGWTLIGSLVNSGTRRWDSLAVWSDASTFGDLDARRSAGYKSRAFASVPGRGFLVRTDEYSIAWHALLGSQTLAAFMTTQYDSAQCSTTFLASGVDWSEGLSEDQERLHGFMVRPLDSNAACFPGCCESAIIGMQIVPAWTPGLGNTPFGNANWSGHDLSLLRRSNLAGVQCTAGVYPCNDLGYRNGGSNCYDTSCKVRFAEMYVR